MDFYKGKKSESRGGFNTSNHKPSNEDLDEIYDEFETEYHTPSRRQTAFWSDEFSTHFSPSTSRTNTRGETARSRLPTTAGSQSSRTLRPSTVRNLASRCGTARPITGTADGDQSVGLNRPLTAIRGAGYMPGANRPRTNAFDPLNMSSSGIGSVKLEPDETPLNKVRKLELRIWELLDESAMASNEAKLKKALELAKDAELKERVLQKQEEEEGYIQSHDWDLTFSVIFTLARQYEENELYAEALNYYASLSREKFSIHGPKVKLNMGNIFVKQRQYEKAIKIYRMALDQLGTGESKRLRIKLMQNMGLVFLQLDNYADAATSFETIMVEKPSFEAAFHLVIVNYLMKDVYGIKTSFQELLQIPLPQHDGTLLQLKDDPNLQIMFDVFSHDALSKYAEEKIKFAEKCVLTAARLIAPLVEDTLSEGYDWVINSIKDSQHSLFSSALEITKAVQLIKQGEVEKAVSILQEFEKKETKFLPTAANNLSFIYFLQGDYSQALKYGEMAVSGDCYNWKSFINLGNSLAAVGDLERARTLYFEGFRLDSSSVEAMYNLGLVDQRLGHFENALISFKKILSILPNYGDVLYEIAFTYELLQNPEKAIEYYIKTLAVNQYDSGIFKKLGINADRMGDKQQAHLYYSDSFKCNPSDPFVIKWLAMYMIESDLPDRAMEFFQNGLALDSKDPIWLLSMATCQKQLGNTGAAILFYKQTLQMFPDNLEALEGLVSLSKCLDVNETDWYRKKLERITGSLPKRKTIGWESPAGLSQKIFAKRNNQAGSPTSRYLPISMSTEPEFDPREMDKYWDFDFDVKRGKNKKEK